MDFQSRYAFFTQLIWTIDKYIFFLAVILAIFIVFYVIIKKYVLKRNDQKLTRIKKKFERWRLEEKRFYKKHPQLYC